jgi:hypothetical protein
MGDHAQPVVDGGLQLIKGGIAMSGGYDDALLREELGDGCPGVLLGSKGTEPNQTRPSIKQALSVIDGSGANVSRLMGPDESGRRIQERPLDMETRNDLSRQLILLTQTNHVGQLGRKAFDAVRNEGGENAVDPIVD